jgi:uncharacterized protein YbaR (Trm112 family)
MKRELMDILACPVCKGAPLELEVLEENDGDIVSGIIRCTTCGIDYPIEDSIPNMLPPEDG